LISPSITVLSAVAATANLSFHRKMDQKNLTWVRPLHNLTVSEEELCLTGRHLTLTDRVGGDTAQSVTSH
jgi:hypothetical protein